MTEDDSAAITRKFGANRLISAQRNPRKVLSYPSHPGFEYWVWCNPGLCHGLARADESVGSYLVMNVSESKPTLPILSVARAVSRCFPLLRLAVETEHAHEVVF